MDEETLGVAESSLETVSGDAGSDAAEVFEIDGERYTREQLAEAIEAWRNREQWNAAFKQRDQRLAEVRSAIEAGFGKRLTDLDENDLIDLRAMGVINAKLRSDPAFAKAWEESLVEAYKRIGATAAEAQQQAARDVEMAKAGGHVKLPAEIEEKLSRIDVLENALLEQSLSQFEARLDGTIKETIEKTAGDLVGKFYPVLRREVLLGLSGHSDAELIEAYRDGSLLKEIQELARGAAKNLRSYLDEKKLAEGSALAAAKQSAAPGPMKGGAGEIVEKTEYVPGRGLTGFHERMRRGL